MEKSIKTYFYQVSGMTLDSEIALPDLIKTDSAPDVRIRYGKIAEAEVEKYLDSAETLQKRGFRIRVAARAIFIEWERLGKVLIRDGAEVTVEPDAGVLEEDLQPFLTGPVLSVLLHQRGCFVLHASSVVIDRAAVIFLGAKGYGKSTLAAHLQVRGHRLISDDIVPVNFDEDRVLICPGYPRIKLFEDSIAAVGENPQDLPLIHRFVEKRSFQCAENFSTAPIVLRAVYVLAEAETVSLEKLNAADAFIEITKNTYLNKYLEALDSLPEHFRQCRKLIASVPVYRLKRPHDFGLMNEVCAALEDHLAEFAGGGEI